MLLFRIFLILAILAGAGVIALNQFQVKPHVQGIIDVRNQETARANTAETNLKNTRKKLDDTEKTLANTTKQLGDTQKELADTKTQVQKVQDQANALKQDLDKTKEDLRAKDQELSAWKNLLIPVEGVRALIASEKKLREAVEALELEKKILSEAVKMRDAELERYRGKQVEDPVLPAGLKGKVLVVDPKWRFVVLDIGAKDNLRERGVLMVSRNGKLVAKVRVMAMHAERSIANVMPGWNLDEIMEGDVVLY